MANREYTSEELDSMSLQERMDLYNEGAIEFGDVNRPEPERPHLHPGQHLTRHCKLVRSDKDLKVRRQKRRRKERRDKLAWREHLISIGAMQGSAAIVSVSA